MRSMSWLVRGEVISWSDQFEVAFEIHKGGTQRQITRATLMSEMLNFRPKERAVSMSGKGTERWGP